MDVIYFIKQRYNNLYHRISNWGLSISPVWIELNSGFYLGIDSLVSIKLFSEIFVTEVYSEAFEILGNVELIVDLGANRGLFMIYSYHKLKLLGYAQIPQVICVEPADENLDRLFEQIDRNHLTNYVTPVRGVVTDSRNGIIKFKYYSRHHVTGSILPDQFGKSMNVNIIDLSSYVQNREVDILKIDIEGAEEKFLREYQDILNRTRVLIIEFHLKFINHELCKSMISSAGLVLYGCKKQQKDNTIIEIYTKPK